jgi:GT2 family glycosyltransferase
MGTHSPLVSVTIVTHNSELSLARCLDSVLFQDWPAMEIIVVDNDSQDRTREILAAYEREYSERLRVIHNASNRGFAAGQNQAIGEACGEWILALNPDVLLTPNFVASLIEAGAQDDSVGTVCGKLLRALPNLSIPEGAEMDSAGIYFTPTFRHFDRGMHQPDGPQYDEPAYVFGATGAAAFYRRKMVLDVSIEGQFFDEDFFFSREDADLSWRAQLLGWKCLYTPTAVGYHVRRVFPGVRKNLPEMVNRHSVKNRFLMRIKNSSWSLYLRHFIPVTVRDLGILAYCTMRERASFAGLAFIFKNWSRTLEKRRIIQQRRRVPDSYIHGWFQFRPVTQRAALPYSSVRPHASPTPAPLLTVAARETGSTQLP